MERIELNLLKAEFNAQIKEIEKIFADIDDRKRGAKKIRQNSKALPISFIISTVPLKTF